VSAHRAGCDLVVVSHPAVLPVNQLVYAELARRGFRVELVVPALWRHDYADAPFAAVPLPELGGSFHPRRVWLAGHPQRHAYQANPVAVIRRLRPAVVFCEQEPFSVAAAQWGLAAHALGVPFGVQMAENLDRPLPGPARLIRAAVLPRAAFIAARSDTAARLARSWGASGDVRLIPHHVPGWPRPERHLHNCFTVGYAGRLVPEKGLDTLVAAVRRLKPPVELLVAGDGPLLGWLESADLGDATLRVIRGTDHAQMASVYAEMDVLVLPSRTTPSWVEQFGRVLVEALWCGTPVVGSDSGEIPWVIETTGGGLVFPEGDDEALADRLGQLRRDPGLHVALAERGRARSVGLFGVGAVADRMEAVLRDAAGLRGHQSPPMTRKPVIALVAHGVHDHGGMERACAELLRRANHKVDFVVVAADLAPALRPLVQRWVRIRVPPRPIPLKFMLFWFLAGRALRRLDADLVHTVGAIVPNRIDVASIHFCHAGFLAANSVAPRATPRLRRANTCLSRVLALAAERWSYRPSRLRAFAAVSQGVAAEVTSHYPVIPVTVTPNGVDVDRFRPDPEVRAALRSAEAVGDGVVALFVGGDWDRKGLGIAIEAVDKARVSGHDVHLWVVGQGDATRFAALAEQSGVAQAVRFFGPRPDTQRFYQAADIFVLPSAYETFSLVCFEAAACGLPLIVPPVSGAVEIVGSTEGGLLVTRSGHSIAHALTKLAADPALRDRLGAEARRRASTYTWQRSAGSVMALYETVLAEREVKR